MPVLVRLRHLSMRALGPSIARSTSGSVAMVVSPGVDIASAPCATPQRERPGRVLAGQQAVDQPRGERVAAAHAVEDLDLALRDLVERALVVRDRAPAVDAGRARGAQRGRDGRDVGVRVRPRRRSSCGSSPSAAP